MIDVHVHLERGPYTKEWLLEFINQAKSRKIKKLFLLEHSHRFIEFTNIYESIFKNSLWRDYQRKWYKQRTGLKLKEYKEFIEGMRDLDFPIEVNFGLEVCYFPDKEDEIKQIVSDFNWDFITGSIHWIDGWGFDHKKESWKNKDIDMIYKRYYELMIQLVDSKIFHVLAHPDSIKCFNCYPKTDLTEIYNRLAASLKKNKVKTEFNNGLYINYKHEELGLDRKLLKILLDNEVEIVTGSDAHRPQDAGRYIIDSVKIIEEHREKSRRGV